MKAIINIDKKVALLAGVNNFGEYEIEFDPADLTPEQREELLLSETKGSTGDYLLKLPSLKMWDSNSWCTGYRGGEWSPIVDKYMPKPTSPGLESMKQMLDARIIIRKEIQAFEEDKKAKGEAEQAEKKAAKIAEFLDTPAEKLFRVDYASDLAPKGCVWIGDFGIGHSGSIGWFQRNYGCPEVDAKIAEVEALFPAAMETAWEKYNALQAEKDRKAAEEQALKAEWVSQYGTDDMKERFEAGVLPEDELLDVVRDHLYAPLNDFPRYQKMKKGDICEADENEYEDHRVSYKTEDLTEMTADQFAMMKKIKAAAPEGAVIEARKHVGVCADCPDDDGYLERVGFMVRVAVGDFEFSREYGMPEE